MDVDYLDHASFYGICDDRVGVLTYGSNNKEYVIIDVICYYSGSSLTLRMDAKDVDKLYKIIDRLRIILLNHPEVDETTYKEWFDTLLKYSLKYEFKDYSYDSIVEMIDSYIDYMSDVVEMIYYKNHDEKYKMKGNLFKISYTDDSKYLKQFV